MNAFDHSDISEWNEQEMERWQLGQIALKIEHDKPLIVISMWTLREWSVCDDGEYEWIWNSFERREAEGSWPKGATFPYLQNTGRYSKVSIVLVHQNSGFILIVLAFTVSDNNDIVHIKLNVEIRQCGNIGKKGILIRRHDQLHGHILTKVSQTHLEGEIGSQMVKL